MKRPALVTAVTTIQLLFGLLMLGVSVYLLVVTGPNAAVGTTAPLGAVALLGGYGMWRGKRWGWWLALLIDLLWLSLFVYAMIDDGWRQVDVVLLLWTLGSVVPVILLLLPAVRRFYWLRPALPAAS